jgi:(2Fe-2S) ferredoxin
MINTTQYTESKVFSLIEKEQFKDPYLNSPFMTLKSMSSKKKGKYFELMYAEYMTDKGNLVERPDSSEHDRKVNGIKKEIKGSFLWGSGTHFRWQQIRTAQDYDDVVFVCIYPDRVEFYEADKNVIKSIVEKQNEKGEWIHNQHGGKKVNSGTFFLDGLPTDFNWMKPV